MRKVALITGASSGIGKEIAKTLIRHNYIVYGAARSVEKMVDLVEMGGNIVFLDITNDNSIRECIRNISEKEGRIDILINNAGYGFYGAVETVSLEEARKQIEVNVFGLARMIQLVLPTMHKQKSGKIVNISSIAGKLTSPLGGWYFASKHAIEGLSDSLRQEVKPFGVDVIIIEPGGIQSEWASIAKNHLLNSSQDTVYAELAKKVTDYFPFVEKQNAPPSVISSLVLKAVEAKNPRTRYVGGRLAFPLLLARKILPDKWFDAALRLQLGY